MLGARTIVRVGTCGALAAGAGPRRPLIVGTAPSAKTALRARSPARRASPPTRRWRRRSRQPAAVGAGDVASVDLFYEENPLAAGRRRWRWRWRPRRSLRSARPAASRPGRCSWSATRFRPTESASGSRRRRCSTPRSAQGAPRRRACRLAARRFFGGRFFRGRFRGGFLAAGFFAVRFHRLFCGRVFSRAGFAGFGFWLSCWPGFSLRLFLAALSAFAALLPADACRRARFAAAAPRLVMSPSRSAIASSWCSIVRRRCSTARGEKTCPGGRRRPRCPRAAANRAHAAREPFDVGG